jgi:hypothetical protein
MSNLRRLKNPNCATDAIMYDMHARGEGGGQSFDSVADFSLSPSLPFAFQYYWG